MGSPHLPVVVAITGASGAVYGQRLTERLVASRITVHLLVSRHGDHVMREERGQSVDTWLEALDADAAVVQHTNDDFTAPVASGSFRHRGMIIAPCSMGTLGRIACGVSTTLIERAADVTLKERRRLIIVARETPLSAIHLENMLTLTRAGAIVVPPVPAFYSHPASIDEIVDQTVDRVLDLIDLPAAGAFRWGL